MNPIEGPMLSYANLTITTEFLIKFRLNSFCYGVLASIEFK